MTEPRKYDHFRNRTADKTGWVEPSLGDRIISGARSGLTLPEIVEANDCPIDTARAILTKAARFGFLAHEEALPLGVSLVEVRA